jgi:hypothetical protein
MSPEVFDIVNNAVYDIAMQRIAIATTVVVGVFAIKATFRAIKLKVMYG